MSYIVMARIYFCVEEPDGGITEESETVENTGDVYETLEEAKAELAEAKKLYPHSEFWISERGD